MKVSKGIMKSIARDIEKAIQNLGYQSNWEFYNAVKPPMSYESVRRLFEIEKTADDHHPLKPVGIETIIKLAYCAGCSKEQIQGFCNDYGEKLWADIVGDGDEPNSPKVKALVEATEEITGKNKALWKNIAENLELLSSVAGVDIKHLTKKIR